jgi:hypothetical protein
MARNLTVVPILPAVMTLSLVMLGLGCASGGCPAGDGYRAVGCNAAAARDQLRYGLSRNQAIDAIGRFEVEPPWKNEWGAGPEAIRNPFDTRSYTSALGEEYEVTRFFVEAWGVSSCPFVQGRLQLEPLIFLEDELVGWSWPYLQDLLGRGLAADETGWSFGMFCDRIGRPPPAPTN